MYHSYLLILMALLLSGGLNSSPSWLLPVPAMAEQTDYDSVRPRNLYGEYQGRIPCNEVAVDLGMPYRAACIKRKVFLYLLMDTITGQPTTYRLSGIGDKLVGKWVKIKGTPADPQAIVYELKRPGRSLFLLEGDRNVLFVLDQQRNFLKGNAEYSYTLNRIRKHISWDAWGDLINKGLSLEE